MIESFLLRLRGDQSGSVMSEFAIWTAMLFIVIMTALDFAGYYSARGAINEAVSATALQAFQQRDKTDASSNQFYNEVPAYVRNLADDQSLAVELSCNGVANSCTNTNRTCACLTSEAKYVATACSAECKGTGMTANSVAGYYLTIKASRNYDPLLLPRGVLAGTALDQTTTVRLQ